MEKWILTYWQELSQKYISDQVFYIMTYWTLTEFVQVLLGKKDPERPEEWRTCLLISFKDFMNYDVKEAAVRLSDRIEWTMLIKDKMAERLLKRYAAELRSYLLGGEAEEEVAVSTIQNKLYSLMEILYDVAAINTSFRTTPISIKEIAGNLFAQSGINSMADICCGSGGFGLAVWRKLNENEGISYCGMDMELAMCDINRLMTYLCGMRNSEVVWQDLLERHPSEQNKKFDLVLLDIPRGQNKTIMALEYGDWLEESGKKTIYADWAYIIKALETMDEKGKSVVIATSGSLVRKNESVLRKKVIRQDWIEAVITLPVNLYPNDRTGSEMIIFNKHKERKRSQKILFVDISRYYYRDNRNYYSISDEGMKLIWKAYKQFCNIPQVSSIIPTTEIDEEVWSLKPVRYIKEEKEQRKDDTLLLKDIAQITRGVQLKKEEEEQLSQQGTALLLNIKDMQDGEIYYEGAKKISPKKGGWHDKFQIRENDIVIATKGTNFKFAIVGKNPPEAYICGNLTLVRVDPKVYHPYVLLEYLTSAKGMRELESIQSGTTIRILNSANLEKLQIPLYHREVLNLVGEHLKNKHENYIQQMKAITEQYTMERKALLEMLGINE